MHIPEGFGQVNMIFTGDAAPTGAEITFGVDMQDYVDSVTQAAADVYTAWTDANIPALYVGALTLATIRVKAGPNDTGPFGEYHPGGVGSQPNPSVSVNTALLVNKATALGGRTGRGRFFMPGVAQAVADADGNVHSGYLTTATNDFNTFLAKLGTQNLAMVLLHAEPHATLGTALVEALVPQPKLATQRRRLRR